MNSALKVAGVSEHELTTSLQTVVDYLWDDEHAAYQGTPKHARRSHVFRSLLVLRRWLDEREGAGKPALSDSLPVGRVCKGGQHD